jgi:hypothetical protein
MFDAAEDHQRSCVLVPRLNFVFQTGTVLIRITSFEICSCLKIVVDVVCVVCLKNSPKRLAYAVSVYWNNDVVRATPNA